MFHPDTQSQEERKKERKKHSVHQIHGLSFTTANKSHDPLCCCCTLSYSKPHYCSPTQRVVDLSERQQQQQLHRAVTAAQRALWRKKKKKKNSECIIDNFAIIDSTLKKKYIKKKRIQQQQQKKNPWNSPSHKRSDISKNPRGTSPYLLHCERHADAVLLHQHSPRTKVMAARKEGWRLAGSSVFAWCFFFNEFGYLIKFICPIRTRDRWDPRIPPAWTRPQSCITSGFCLRESPHTRRHRKYNRVWWGLQQSCCQNPQFTVLGFFFFLHRHR